MKRPRGRKPREIIKWMKLYPDIPSECCICECGRWLTMMDQMAPYHFERSFCKHCDK